jgi:FAD:protein FMN transferase
VAVVERRTDGLWAGRFDAMASSCEVLVDGGDEAHAQRLAELAQAEALRIERKYSRYRADSELSRWHAQAAAHPGEPVEVDDESAGLLDLAALCHGMSGGLFDISSGVLREVWRFDGSDRVPEPAAVARVAARVGWHRVGWQRPRLTLPVGMELDLGGLGKEYAADRVLGLLRAQTDRPLLVNLGGDLVASGTRSGGLPWYVGIEPVEGHAHAGSQTGPQTAPQTAADAAPRVASSGDPATGLIALRGGALATSGDARRYLLKDGVRYSHILDPRTGWPVRDAPRSVTVGEPTRPETSLVDPLAMLQGAGAEALLLAQSLPHWVQRTAPAPA